MLLARSPVFPGGGGQLMDEAMLAWSGGSAAVRAVTPAAEGLWHECDGDAVIADTVRVTIAPPLRRLMSELHTLAHVANSIVCRDLGGALLTGAQLAADGTFRLHFDLPGADSDRLRARDGADQRRHPPGPAGSRLSHGLERGRTPRRGYFAASRCRRRGSRTAACASSRSVTSTG